MYYFTHHKWPQAWINEVVNLTRDIWTSRYKPMPVSAPPVSSPTPAPAAASSHPKKSHVDFNIILNYGDQVAQGLDVLEEHLRTPPLPQETVLHSGWAYGPTWSLRVRRWFFWRLSNHCRLRYWVRLGPSVGIVYRVGAEGYSGQIRGFTDWEASCLCSCREE